SLSYQATARTGRFTVIRANRRAAMEKSDGLISDNIEVVPVVVLSQTFAARPSSIPDVRDFVRRCLAQSPLSEEDNREVGDTVAQALLEAAGATGAINVSFRIFPDHVEVDVLRSGGQIGTPAGLDALASLLQSGQPAMPGRDGLGPRPGAQGIAGGMSRGAAPRPVGARFGEVEVGPTAPGGPDHAVCGPPARRLGQDGEPLGRRRH